MSRRRKTKEKEEVEQVLAPPEPTGLMYQPFQVPQFDPSYQGAMNRYFKPVPEEDLKTDMKLITSGGKRPEVKVVLSALEETRMGRGKGKRSKRADQKRGSAMDIERQKVSLRAQTHTRAEERGKVHTKNTGVGSRTLKTSTSYVCV
jgi:hypothetical protein